MLSRFCEEPQIVYRDGFPVRAMFHYGATTDDLKKHFAEILSLGQLQDLLSLWADPEVARVFIPVGESLIIARDPGGASR